MKAGTRTRVALLAALVLAGCATAPESPPAPPAAVAAAPPASQTITISEMPPTPPSGMQWLYGSGEGAAASVQAYHALRDFVLRAARSRPAQSVVLDDGSTLESPRFVPCGVKPLAVVLDVDETAIQNLGYEFYEATSLPRYNQEVWNRWEQTGGAAVAAMPGARTALGAIRDAGVAVIFNSNRQAANADQTEAALDGVGLGPARHGETLFLQGDVAPGSGKDPRRAAIAGRYCIIAMAGDQLGDFSDLFNARTLSVPDRRRAAASAPFAPLWGHGWFLLSNPVYGPGIRGNYDEVFPADTRWTDPARGNE